MLSLEINNPKIILPKIEFELEHVWHLFVIRTDKRDSLQNFLINNGIQTVIHYPIPPHKQMAYKKYNIKSFPISEFIHETIISLPISHVLKDGEVSKIIEKINEYR